MLTTLKLDEGAKLEFGVAITGASGQPESRFVIEGEKFSLMLPCRQINDSLEVEIPPLKGMFNSGEYSARLEVVIENKLYTPLNESITLEPSVEIESKVKPQTVKESVQVAKVTVKKVEAVNENLLRKTHAATIIAKAVGYKPEGKESPEDTIKNAVASMRGKKFSDEQHQAVKSMLKLAEQTGIETAGIEVQAPLEVKLVEANTESDDSEITDQHLDDMIGLLSDEDFFDAYDADELEVHDEEGNVIHESINETEQLNEVLSRVERIRAKIRFARTKSKRTTKLKLALKHASTSKTFNKRARHMAVMAVEKMLARGKAKSQLSTAEKERVEKIVQHRKALIDRLAMKLMPRVKQHERERLAHHLTK